MLSKLEGFAAALLGALDAVSLAEVADELASIQRTLLATPQLRGVLADTSISGPTRGRVLGDLLRARVSPTVERLAVYAAVISPAQEVASSIADLAQRALVVSETGQFDYQVLGLLGARRRVTGFADAILADLSTDIFSEIEEDLFRWARTIEANRDLRRVMLDRDAPVASRLELVTALLSGKVGATALTLALYVVEGGRPRDVVGTLDYLVDYVARARQWRVARVHSARQLDEATQAELTRSLSAFTGAPVEVHVVDEPDLLGGIIVEVGDLRLDASMRGRLATLHEAVSSGHFLESTLSTND